MLNVKDQKLFSDHHELPPNNYDKKKLTEDASKLKCERTNFFLNNISYTKIKVKQTK